jgi:CheY-like chemotaxis protein
VEDAMSHERPLIAIVNDEAIFVRLLDTVLRDTADLDTLLLHVGAIAHESIKQQQPDLIILDISTEQPAVSWQLFDLLLIDPGTAAIPILLCSAPDELLRDRAEKLRLLDFRVIQKPFELDELLRHVRALLSEHGSA